LSAIRNKLQQTYKGARVAAQADAKALIAEQLIRLEDDLRRLKIEFDIFLNGGAKRPPYDTKNRVETIIKRLADERSMPYAQRYLYNSLVGRFTAFQNQWRRNLQKREGGMMGLRHRITEEKPLEPPVTAPALPPAAQGSFVCADAGQETQTVRAMYETLVEAKRQCGQNPEDVSFDLFQKVVASKTQSLRERYQCERVRFAVSVDNGQVNFKAQADKS
jgi:hypothetical protein